MNFFQSYKLAGLTVSTFENLCVISVVTGIAGGAKGLQWHTCPPQAVDGVSSYDSPHQGLLVLNHLLKLLKRAWMSLVHHVRGMRSCRGGLELGSLSFKLEDVAWGYQRISDIIYASG